MDYLLSEIIKRANRYLTELPTRRISPAPDAVAGTFMANFTGLAAARHALLEQQGWDVESLWIVGRCCAAKSNSCKRSRKCRFMGDDP